MDQERINSFREKLDKHYAWPSVYVFKFIVPAGKEQQVKDLFPRHETSEKLSKEGKYISVSVQVMMPSSEAVIATYEQPPSIEGIVAL